MEKIEVTLKAYREIKVLVDLDSRVYKAIKGIRGNLQAGVDDEYDYTKGETPQVTLEDTVEWILNDAARGW